MVIVKNKYLLIFFALILILGGVWLLLNSSAQHRLDEAGQIAKTRVKDLVGENEVLTTESSNYCFNSSVIQKIFKAGSCAVAESQFYVVAERENLMEDLYVNVTTNKGWWVLDNGRLNDYGFDEQGYLIGTTHEGNGDMAFTSDLTIRIIDSADLGSLANRLNETSIQSLKNTNKTIVEVNVSTRPNR